MQRERRSRTPGARLRPMPPRHGVPLTLSAYARRLDTELLLSDDVNDEAPPVRPRAVLPDVYPLPDAEGELAVAHRNGFGATRQRGFCVSGHVIRAFVV